MCLLSQYGKKQSFLNPSPGARDLEVSVFVIPEREGKPYEATYPCEARCLSISFILQMVMIS